MTDANETNKFTIETLCDDVRKLHKELRELVSETATKEKQNNNIRSELVASNNWLHRLLQMCVIMLDNGEVTKRAVEKQIRYNRMALDGKPYY